MHSSKVGDTALGMNFSFPSLFYLAETYIITVRTKQINIKSPYATKRMRPLALQFTDFERAITTDEFAKIPGYDDADAEEPMDSIHLL